MKSNLNYVVVLHDNDEVYTERYKTETLALERAKELFSVFNETTRLLEVDGRSSKIIFELA